MQAKAAQPSPRTPAAQRTDSVSQAMSAEAWMQEALRVRPDARTGAQNFLHELNTPCHLTPGTRPAGCQCKEH